MAAVPVLGRTSSETLVQPRLKRRRKFERPRAARTSATPTCYLKKGIARRQSMTLFKRTLWLVAWSVWLWLGFGLARQLPMNATVVCRLNLDKSEIPQCFINDGCEFVSILQGREVRIRDVESGAITRRYEVSKHAYTTMGVEPSHRFPFLATCGKLRPNWPKDRDPYELAILDLRNGTWTDVSGIYAGGRALHSEKPWCICWGKDGQVTVVDIVAGRVVFQRNRKVSSNEPVGPGEPFFLGDDRLAIPLRWHPSDGGAKYALEIWKILDPSQPFSRFEEVAVYSGAVASADGSRILSGVERNGASVNSEVFDVNLGRHVLPKEGPTGEIESVPGEWSRAISSDGRSFLETAASAEETRLYNVESASPIWHADHNESAFVDKGYSDRFVTHEDWNFERFGWKYKLETWTVRSLKDESLLFRCWAPPLGRYVTTAADGQLFCVHHTREVHRLPFRVNWPLLALCQTILALPLVLLWAVLQWRRRRRLRMASVTP
jgi:hypothetical protein